MRIFIELVAVLIVVGIAAALLASAMGRRRPQREPQWRVHTRTRTDGTLVVGLRHPDAEERVVRELAADLEGVELASALQLAKDDAALAADELNRP